MESTEYEYAGFWARTGATIIDTILLMLIITPIIVSVYGWSYFTDEGYGIIAGPADFLVSWVFPAIAVIVLWILKQATPGKIAISSKIVDATTGKPASPAQLIGRYFAYFVSMLPLFLGFIWIAFDKRKQGWHEKLSSTVVIKKTKTGPEPVSFNGV